MSPSISADSRGLLHAGFDGQANGLRFDNCERIVTPVVQEIVGTPLLAATNPPPGDNDPSVGETALFANGMRFGRPTGLNEPRGNIFPTGVRFGDHAFALPIPVHCCALSVNRSAS